MANAGRITGRIARGRALVDALSVSQFLTAYNASLANVLELKTSTITGILKSKGDRSMVVASCTGNWRMGRPV